VWQKIISYVWQIGGFLYGKDYQLRVADWWFSLGTLVSSTNKQMP
jgi:hypothetical protein